jgi:oligopeptide transport system substrate-binding protein
MKALDPYTLQVTLENPTPFFLALLYHQSLYPVPRKVIEKFGAKWTRPENMVSNGAFELDKWEMNKVISVKPNPYFWDKSRVVLTQVNFFPIQQLDTEEKMFRAGKLDITNEIPLEKIPYWQKDSSGVYQQFPYLGMYWYLINVTKAPLNNKKVRQALALSIDRTALVKYVLRGGQLPGVEFVPPGTGGYQPVPHLPANLSQLAKAKELLKEAGYPDGKGLPPIELLYNTSEGHKKIAEALQEMWKKNLGIDVRLYNQEWKVFLDSQSTMNYQMSRLGWIADYNDPNTFLDQFMTGNGNNHTGWSNKTYDKLIESAGKETNRAKRFALFQKAEALMADELPAIPIYVYTRLYLKNPAVQGWYNNIEDIHPLNLVSMSPKN